MSSTNITAVTLEQILSRDNLIRALKQVKANKGAPGIDGMKVDELQPYINGFQYPIKLTQAVLDGTYKPAPIKRVYIPKDNGEQRPLGIPTVMDRVIQQAVAQVLSNVYEPLFSDNSFGFRPGRGTKDAIAKATEYVNDGLCWVIDLDLAKFFDTVNHSKLLQVLSNQIGDGRIISPVHKFLRAPVSESGKVGGATTIGTPQGSCVSPILANILLNELDQRLDKRNIKFVRYADDMVVFCGSKRAAERILGDMKNFIEKKLFLRINETKTKIVKVSKDVQFLGFTYTNRVSANRKKRNPQWKMFPTVHRKKLVKVKSAIKDILDRRAPGGMQAIKERLARKLRGWCNYFKQCIPERWTKEIDGWIRRRIRQMYWKQWKTATNRWVNFKMRCIKAPSMKAYAYSSSAYWRMALTLPINMVLSNAMLEQEGWVWIQMFRE